MTPTTQSVVVPVDDLLFYKLKDLILEQSEGEWTDAMIVKDAHHFANHLRPLLAAAPAPSSLAGGAQEIVETLAALTSGQVFDEFDRGARAARLDALDMMRPLAALSPEATAREGPAFAISDGMTTHPTLRSANIARQDEWDQDGQITASYRGNELAGEVGEACNVIKKLERERLGILGSRATIDELGDELADVMICADLIAMHYGIDLEAAVARKFNATSEKVGLSTRLAAPADGGQV